MAVLDLRLHWTLAACIVVLDVLLVASIIAMDKWHHVEPPAAGEIDTSAAIGWLGVVGAIFIFGCYGILIKTPAVQEAKCDPMVFQCYSSLAVVFVSMAIWAIAGSSEGMTFDSGSFSMGILFGSLWIVTQICAFNAVQAIGYAVAPAIWVGVTIGTSFLWGVAVFHNPVHDWVGAMRALALMIVGVCLAAASTVVSDKQAHAAPCPEVPEELAPLISKVAAHEEAQILAPSPKGGADQSTTQAMGILYACLLGACNGSLMVPVTCFQNGCPSLGVQAYSGATLAPLAFLPSLAAGILVVHPILFMLYWGRAICEGARPEFHVTKVATPALLTGAFWGMGNFSAMFASVYLGQVVGFPLTQCCLVISGAWGILYFKEIQGLTAVGLFVAASAIILTGATLDGLAV